MSLPSLFFLFQFFIPLQPTVKPPLPNKHIKAVQYTSAFEETEMFFWFLCVPMSPCWSGEHGAGSHSQTRSIIQCRCRSPAGALTVLSPPVMWPRFDSGASPLSADKHPRWCLTLWHQGCGQSSSWELSEIWEEKKFSTHAYSSLGFTRLKRVSAGAKRACIVIHLSVMNIAITSRFSWTWNYIGVLERESCFRNGSCSMFIWIHNICESHQTAGNDMLYTEHKSVQIEIKNDWHPKMHDLRVWR